MRCLTLVIRKFRSLSDGFEELRKRKRRKRNRGKGKKREGGRGKVEEGRGKRKEGRRKRKEGRKGKECQAFRKHFATRVNNLINIKSEQKCIFFRFLFFFFCFVSFTSRISASFSHFLSLPSFTSASASAPQANHHKCTEYIYKLTN